MIEAGRARRRSLKPGGLHRRSDRGQHRPRPGARRPPRRDIELAVVVPDKMTDEKISHLRAMGAEVSIAPAPTSTREHPDYYQEVAARLADSPAPGAFYINQFANEANAPAVHYETTGPEIWAQMDGDLDAFVAGVGSGGTVSWRRPLPQGTRTPRSNWSSPTRTGSILANHGSTTAARSNRAPGWSKESARTSYPTSSISPWSTPRSPGRRPRTPSTPPANCSSSRGRPRRLERGHPA